MRINVRGLRWRLTLSYTLITVVTVLAFELAFLAAFQQWMFGATEFPSVIAGALDDVAPEAAPYLARTPPDAAGLQRWLTDRLRKKYLRLPFDVDVTTGPAALLAVVDHEGRVVVSNNSRLAQPGDQLAPRVSPAAAAVLDAGLRNDPDPAHLATRAPDGQVAVAVPIIGSDGQDLGVLLLVPDLDASYRMLLANALGGIAASAVALLVIFGLLGTLFGYVLARWLTGRLRALTGAVEAWGRGDLDAVARDGSADELGQHARQLNHMAEELRALLQTRQALAVVEERQRLARDLHDAVKQQVFATAMQIGAARALLDRDPAAARAHLAEAEKLAADAQQELTALIRELRPVALTDQGLAAALDRWVRDWSRRTGIVADVRIENQRAAPLEVEQALFRVAQEALANVARHSGATWAEVRLAWGDDAPMLVVADNGRGFPVERPRPGGVGLSSMRERVEALGGTLGVTSGPGGTRIEARLAVEPASTALPRPPALPVAAGVAVDTGRGGALAATEIEDDMREKGKR